MGCLSIQFNRSALAIKVKIKRPQLWGIHYAHALTPHVPEKVTQ